MPDSVTAPLPLGVFLSVLRLSPSSAAMPNTARLRSNLAYPPYNLNPQSIGYLSLGPFIGGILAMLLFSATSDPVTMYMTRKNNGGAGLFRYGYVTQNSGSPYIAATLHGVIIFGVMALIVAT